MVTARTGAMVALLLGGAAAPGLAADVRVRVADGMIAGAVNGDIASFKGIPFAAPPVGPLRWRAPQPPAPWSDVRPAKAFGPSCLQPKNDLDGGVGVREDCLTLNVWTRHPRRGGRLPVMVWIYGGGFVVGSSASPYYDGTPFARRGVVLVSFNYRLGRLGFFAHPALDGGGSGEPVANYGLMDQLAALRWVRANIAAFGGDPANVTVFGESAGAMSVNMLMTSPAGSGLFAKAIAESGFGRNDPPALASAEAVGTAFAARHGIPDGPDAAAALRALPAEEVLGGALTLLDPATPKPMKDGQIVREAADVAFAAGRAAKIPYLIGGNSFESSLFAAAIKADPAAAIARSGVEPARAVALFGQGDPMRAAFNLTTVALITEPDRFLADADIAAGNPVYRYYFSYVPVAERSLVPGAVHGAEVPYVFTSLPGKDTQLGGRMISAATPADLAVADAMQTYWTNFAKTGSPGVAAGVRWPTYVPGGKTMVEFGSDGIAVRPPIFPDGLDAVAAAAKVHASR